jgi:hypothetical protein
MSKQSAQAGIKMIVDSVWLQERNPHMRKNFLALVAAVVVASQLSGCVVYERPHPYWGPHYYHGWYYR